MLLNLVKQNAVIYRGEIGFNINAHAILKPPRVQSGGNHLSDDFNLAGTFQVKTKWRDKMLKGGADDGVN